MLIFKVLGLIIAFSVPSLYGFSKAYSVRKRYTKLKSFITSMRELSEYVKIGNCERKLLFSRCFSGELLIGETCVNNEFLATEDIVLLEEFLIGFGLKDKISEYERTVFYLNRLEIHIKNVKEERDKLCKLYSSLGVLLGLSLCIFLI